MGRRAVLGKVAPESYQDFVDAVEESLKIMEQIGLQEIAGLKPENTTEWNAYKFMNGIGNMYGSALVRAHVKDISPDARFPDTIASLIDPLSMIYNDLEARRSLRDDTVIRQAAEEMPEYMPDWLDLDMIIAAAQASYQGKGVYFNDFYYSVMQIVGDIPRAFRMFLIQEKRPEMVVFRKNKGGGDYIPKAVLDLTEQEERNLLKTVIRETNKKIEERGFYGVRNEPLPRTGDFTVLYWSNGSSVWFVDNRTNAAVLGRDRGLRSIPLDANMVLVPFHSVLVEKVVGALDDLPLYSYSTEAKERGEYPEPTNKNAQKAFRSIVEAQYPDLDREELALKAAELFALFVRASHYDRAAIDEARAWLLQHPVNLFPFVRLIEQWMNS